MNKVACVTGGASGIGFGIAHELAADGFKVAIADIKAEAEGAEVLEHLAGNGHVYISADLSKPAGREAILAEIRKRYERIDALVNNAGVAPLQRRDILDTSEESFDRVMSINLKGPFFLTQMIARYMIELVNEKVVSRPKIVNMSSNSAYTSSVSRPEYCLSKAGVSMMTKLYADRLAEYGINVYEIRPGIIRTPMTETVQGKYNKLINEDGILPIRRWGEPNDIAQAVKTILAGAFEYSTGEVFNIDGGFHLQRL